MKAPIKINRFLESQGFSFVKGACYMKNVEGSNVISCLDYQKISGYEEINNKYVSIEMSICYPYGDGMNFVINPPPLDALSKDGNLRYSCDKYDNMIWFDIVNLDEMLCVLEKSMAARLADLLNPGLMISVIDFCMGLRPPPNDYQYLEDMPLLKGKSPVNFANKAAYFNMAGKYDEAIETLDDFYRTFKGRSERPLDKKLLSDAKNRHIA
jgi:hypothetical protein